MAVTRIAKGTGSSKTNGATLTLSDISLDHGAMLVVGLGYDDAQGHPTSVTWGNRQLVRKTNRNPGGYDIAMSMWVIPYVKKPNTRDLVATWAAAIDERAMFATQLMGAGRIDDRMGNNDAVGTAAPGTTATVTLTTDQDFALCAFVSQGPSRDAPGTAEIKDAGSFVVATSGQRAGTAGAPPLSNVTIQETYLHLTATDATEGRLQDATARLWVSAILAVRISEFTSRGISPSDLINVDQLFEDHVPSLNVADALWRFNGDSDEWEVYDRADIDTRIGHYLGETTGEWTTG